MEALRLARVEGIAGRRLSVHRGLCAAIGATSSRATTRDAGVHARIAPVGAHGCTRSPRVDAAIGRMNALGWFGVGLVLCVGLRVVRAHRAVRGHGPVSPRIRRGSGGRRGAASERLDKNRRGDENQESSDIHEQTDEQGARHAGVPSAPRNAIPPLGQHVPAMTFPSGAYPDAPASTVSGRGAGRGADGPHFGNGSGFSKGCARPVWCAGSVASLGPFGKASPSLETARRPGESTSGTSTTPPLQAGRRSRGLGTMLLRQALRGPSTPAYRTSG